MTLLDSFGFWTIAVILSRKKTTIVLDPNNVLSGLMAFSIVGAIVLLAIAIVAYPSIKDRYSHSSKKAAK